MQKTSPGPMVKLTSATASTPPGSASPVPSASFAACAPMRVDLGTVSVDGHPATFLEESDAGDCGGTYALVPVGDQMYVFTVWLPNKESTLMTFLESVRFLS